MISEKPTTVRLPAELRARAEDAARIWSRSPYPSLSAFLAWVVCQVIDLDFLTPENREFVRGIASELGSPWTALGVINVIVSAMRRELRAGRVVEPFYFGQAISPKKSEEPRRDRAAR